MHRRCASLQPKTKKQYIGLLSFLVAGMGFEPPGLAKFSAENLASVSSAALTVHRTVIHYRFGRSLHSLPPGYRYAPPQAHSRLSCLDTLGAPHSLLRAVSRCKKDTQSFLLARPTSYARRTHNPTLKRRKPLP